MANHPNETPNAGTEGLRLGYSTVKKADKTIRTAQRTIKTTEKTAKKTAKVTYKVTKTVVKITAKTVKAIAKGVIKIISVIPPPILLILVGAMLFMLLMLGTVMVIAGGVAGGTNATKSAYENALGLAVPAEDYAYGASFYTTAMKDAKSSFEAKIDALSYDAADLAHSDLVYFTRSSPGNPNAKLEHSELATDAIKTQIKNTWLPSLSEQEVLAIAYVYLQKQENEAQGTTGALYQVEYTQETLDTVVAALYVVTENVHERQQCPGKDCDTHKVINPTWTYFDEKLGEAAKIINGELPGDKEQARVDYVNYMTSRDNTPKEIDEAYCPKMHDNHSIALTFYDKTSVLMQLGLGETPYAEWVEMTITGFEKNEEIP